MAASYVNIVVLGAAALTGQLGGVALLAGIALPIDRLVEQVFRLKGAREHRRLKSLCECLEADLAQDLGDPGTHEAARLQAETLLHGFGLKDEDFARLGLDENEAARTVIGKDRIPALDRSELEPRVRRILACFYKRLATHAQTFPDLLPFVLRAQFQATLKTLTNTEEILRLLREDKAATSERAVRLAGELGITQGALAAFFAILGEGQVAPEALPAKLVEIAQGHKASLAQAEPQPDDTAAVAALRASVRAALEAGSLDEADDLLARILALGDAEDRARRDLEDAAVWAERGDLAMTRLRYAEAARHFRAAALQVPRANQDRHLAYLDRETDALDLQGSERGDNVALETAIARYRDLLALRPRERVPLDWAMTQNNLGNALAILGEREAGTGRLEEAVEAFRAALLERTRERVPLDWAMTQNNLGNALQALGEREAGTGRLEAAVAAYRAALEERTQERVPLDWATTQNNLGAALRALGEREAGTGRLEEAVAAFRAALEERTRERVPLDWAGTQNNLGNALFLLAERRGDPAPAREGLGCLEDARTVYVEEAGLTQYAAYFDERIAAARDLIRHLGG